MDRYSGDTTNAGETGAGDRSVPPYGQAAITPELMLRHCCSADSSLLATLIPLPVPRDRVAVDLLLAVLRQGDAFGKHSGKRHVFLLLHEMDRQLTRETTIQRLKTLTQDNSIVLHGICQNAPDEWGPLRDFCLSNPEGTFDQATAEGLADKLVQVYANLLNRYEITYSLPAGGEPGRVLLKVASGHGSGQAEFTLTAAAPQVPTSSEESAVPDEESPVPEEESPDSEEESTNPSDDPVLENAE